MPPATAGIGIARIRPHAVTFNVALELEWLGLAPWSSRSVTVRECQCWPRACTRAWPADLALGDSRQGVMADADGRRARPAGMQ